MQKKIAFKPRGLSRYPILPRKQIDIYLHAIGELSSRIVPGNHGKV